MIISEEHESVYTKYKKYDMEHGADMLFEGPCDYVLGYCARCGEPVLDTEHHYIDGSSLVHAECLMEYIENNYTAEALADSLGMKEMI